MSKTYAAFYLPQEIPPAAEPNPKMITKLKGRLSSAWNSIKNVPNFSFDDLKDMAKHMNLQGSTEFTQIYATEALTKILNGQAVTNQTMLDSLFNTYAPALNAGLAQTGYNSIMEMRNAVKSGNINVANFVQGFSNGLSIVQEMNDRVEYSKYGEEVPIDVVKNCKYTYQLKDATQKIDANDEFLQKYLTNLTPLKLELTAHVMNQNAELWSINDFSSKIVDVMDKKEYIYIRIGKSIYENCYFKLFEPTITSIYEIQFKSEIILNHESVAQSYQSKYGRIMKTRPPRGNFDVEICNAVSKEVYGGIITA